MLAQFTKEIGDMWQWFEMGNCWGGAGTNNAVDQERCKVVEIASAKDAQLLSCDPT